MEKFIATLFLVCAVGLGITSLATSHWQEIKGTPMPVHYGLFQTCTSFLPGLSVVLCANNLEGWKGLKTYGIEKIWTHIGIAIQF